MAKQLRSGNNGRDVSSRDKSGRDGNQPRKFACIEWISESPDSLDFTHNVPLEWVKGYDPEQEDDSYVVEWRQPPCPRTGWHVYDGFIHEVSEDEDYLKSVMKRKKKEASDARSRSKGENSNNGSIDINSPVFQKMLADAVQGAVQGAVQRSPQQPRENRHSNQTEEKVLVGKALQMDRTSYNMAKLASSPGRMVTICLRQAYSRRRLIRSSYAGQARTVDNVRKVKPSIKKYQKTRDMQNFILERFPHVSQSTFSSIVNQALGKKANRKPEKVYVAESASEEEVGSDEEN